MCGGSSIVKLVINYGDIMAESSRVEYWHEWSKKGSEALNAEVQTLYKNLDEKQKKEAKEQIQICLMNLEYTYQVLNIFASYPKKDHKVFAYVDRCIDYINYKRQQPEFNNGLMFGIHNCP